VKEIELRRHARRDPSVDALSPEGRVQAEDVGRTLRGDYAVVFVSPARRSAETMAWFLRATGQPLPDHATVRGLVSERDADWHVAADAAGTVRLDALMAQDPALVAEESSRLASVVESLLERTPDGRRSLAVGHTPLLEAAVYGLTGVVVEPLAECEGVLVIRADADGPDAETRITEIRLGPAA
jgi:broad specificity phosphatase PhoE